MIVGISLILITIGLVLFLSFGPGNSTQQYYMAAAPAKKNDCPGGKKRDPKTGECPVDKKVDPKVPKKDPKVPKKDPKVPPKKVDPKVPKKDPMGNNLLIGNCKNGMKIDPKTGKCGYQLQVRGWDTVVDTASLTGNQPPQKPLEFVTEESFPDASGKCGKGTTLQKNGRCGPNKPTLSGVPPVNGQIVPPNNPIVTGVGFGDTVFQGNQPQGVKPPAVNPISPAVVVVPPGDKPKPPGDKPPPPVVVVPAGGGGDKPKPRPPVKCKAGYIETSPGVCVPEDLGEIPGEGGGGAA